MCRLNRDCLRWTIEKHHNGRKVEYKVRTENLHSNLPKIGIVKVLFNVLYTSCCSNQALETGLYSFCNRRYLLWFGLTRNITIPRLFWARGWEVLDMRATKDVHSTICERGTTLLPTCRKSENLQQHQLLDFWQNFSSTLPTNSPQPANFQPAPPPLFFPRQSPFHQVKPATLSKSPPLTLRPKHHKPPNLPHQHLRLLASQRILNLTHNRLRLLPLPQPTH